MKKAIYILIFILLFLVLTNPSFDDFKNSGHQRHAIKQRDYIIFSIYSFEEDDSYKQCYIGFIKNFFEFNIETNIPLDSEIKEWQP